MSSLLAFASATACVPPLMSWDMSTATTTPWKQNVKKIVNYNFWAIQPVITAVI